MNKNYFSDITDLFLKVKKEENIKIDESVKADIKQMLQTKISEMKAEDMPTRDTYDDLEPLGPKRSFWSMWKNQLVGVPASLAAIAVVVYAASNLNVSIPKEDFSPTRDTQTNVTQTEAIEEEFVEKEIPEEEFDRPLVKTAPGLLVIDFSDTENDDRSLNKTPTKTIVPVKEESPKEEPATFKTPKVEYTDSATFVLDETEEEETPKEEVRTGGVPIEESKPEPTKEIEEEPSQVERTENPEAEEIVADPVDSLDTDIPAEELIVDEPEQVEIIEDKPAVKEPDTMVLSPEVNAQLNTDVSFPTYTYQDEALKTDVAFSAEKLAKLTRSKTPESVTVYYVKDDQVVVEIEEEGIIKWYLFDNIDETWTISRYEKYLTDSVVK